MALKSIMNTRSQAELFFGSQPTICTGNGPYTRVYMVKYGTAVAIVGPQTSSRQRAGKEECDQYKEEA